MGTGDVRVFLRGIRGKPAFSDKEKRLELVHRLSQIDGVELSDDFINRNPAIPLSALTNDKARHLFLDTLDWFAKQIKES